MSKIVAIIGVLLLAAAFNLNAQDSDRVGQLEKEVQELKLRISKLESLLGAPNTAPRPTASNDGWKSVANWRMLATDMSDSDVRKLLGEPSRINGGNLAVWSYEDGGTVTFYRGKVNQWSEPRR